MVRSEVFFKATLADIAEYVPQHGYTEIAEIRSATPSEVYSAAERLLEEFGVTLPKDRINPNTKRYSDPVLLANWPNTAISIREDINSSEQKSFTFVSLQYQDGIIIAEHDLVSFSPDRGINMSGEQIDEELTTSAAQVLRELELFLDQESTHEQIIDRARQEAGVS